MAVEAEAPRVALVTGGAVRLGRALALALARDGMDVVFTYHRHVEAAAETVAEIERLGRRALALHADLTDPASPGRVVRAARQALGPVDVLVNSAASFVAEPFTAVTPDSFDHQVALNLRAPFFLAQAALPDLARTGRGRVINIGDLSADRPFENQVVHSLTKVALQHLTLAMAVALAPAVQVHAVVPGTVLPPPHYDAAKCKELLDAIPIGRFGAPEDVAEAVLYLVHASPFATGVVVHLDGGARGAQAAG